jgi:hypothetical protein
MHRLNLTRLQMQHLFAGSRQVGEECPACETGHLGVYCVRHSLGRTIRYLKCRTCGHRPHGNKIVDAPLPELPLWRLAEQSREGRTMGSTD